MTPAPVLVPQGVGGVTLLQAAALLPPSLVAAWQAPGAYLFTLLVALIAALGWESAFASLRHHAASLHGISTALVVALFVPPDLGPWQLGLVVSLGVILAELIFGGRGFGFASPATLALALLMLSFPQVALPPHASLAALAALPGAGLLLAFGILSWRVVLAAGATVVAGLLAGGHTVDAVQIASALAIGLIFLIGDPVAAACTNPGRLAYGVLAGALILVFAPLPLFTPAAVVWAALLASLFAPLIDHVVVRLHISHRRRRHG